MAVSLPNGVILALATTYGSSIPMTTVSNANPAVVGSVAHGLANGAIFAVTSGWAKLNDRVVRASGVAANNFNLEGMDTTSTAAYPAGTGTGSVRPVTAFTQISQILDLQTSGGDMQFTSYSFLEQDFETQLPTQASPQNMTITIADDQALAGYIALKAAAEARDTRVLRLTLPNGSILLYNGYVSFNETPVMTKNQVMGVRATFSLLSKPVRY
jgi:hypothetical protein